ncbi:MAG: TRAFs-binding domain-containing protein [Thermodesulfobacteriota bacterium]
MPIRPHAFVAMPFGPKPDASGVQIDFDSVYRTLIGPALEDAGLSVFRADGERRAGDIRTDMFQELLVADLVVADLTIDNPNVWYELGVRHALRSRGVVLLFGGRAPSAFDLYTDRKLRYGLAQGRPDPATLEDDRRNLTEMVRATMESWHGRKISPVYQLLPNLREPDWQSLRVGDVREFWEQHEAWERRIELARKSGEIGDLLVLADEAPVAWFRAEAWIRAGKALRHAGRFAFALEQLERGLAVKPLDATGLAEKGICLQRLALQGAPGHSIARARDHYRVALKHHPESPEIWALLGRCDKDAWTEAWRQPGRTQAQMRDDAIWEDALLRAAIESYAKGYLADQRHYYSGVNALTLMHLHRDLTGSDLYQRRMDPMTGAVRFAAEAERDPAQQYWAKATLGDLQVLIGTPDTVQRGYRDAIAANERDWFALDSSRAQLLLLRDLGFRPQEVTAGIETFDRALARLDRPVDKWQPRQVFLFSGHVIDAPDRASPRFPAGKQDAARQRIDETLERHGAGAVDLAFCQAAAGGDLLFLEACQRRGVRCRIQLPFEEPQFVNQSVLPSADGTRWRSRFYEAIARERTKVRIMPVELGPLPSAVNPFERCNLWNLYSALACGVDKVRVVCLWDGDDGGGPGGTKHMYDEVSRRTGRVDWIDTRTL